ncbi:MAG TPA: antibiotic biosynthesis monooxygenase family protein [Egibacteraceae bacterium]
MNGIARQARVVVRSGHGDEVARILLDAAETLAEDPGCLLYLVSRQRDEPDVLWVTELWRSHADLDRVVAALRGDSDAAAALALAERWEVIELDLLGGKGPPPRGASGDGVL